MLIGKRESAEPARHRLVDHGSVRGGLEDPDAELDDCERITNAITAATSKAAAPTSDNTSAGDRLLNALPSLLLAIFLLIVDRPFSVELVCVTEDVPSAVSDRVARGVGPHNFEATTACR